MTNYDEEKKLLYALTDVNDRYIKDAMEYTLRKKKKPSIQWYAGFTAACAAVLVIGIMMFHLPSTLSHPGNDMAEGNPYQEVSSLEEAEQITGFEMKLPEAQEPYTKVQIAVIDNNMIEADYMSDSGDIGYIIRKAGGSEDITGDYTEYTETVQENINGVTVTLKGSSSQFALAVWTADGYSYSVSASDHPLNRKQIMAIVSEIG